MADQLTKSDVRILLLDDVSIVRNRIKGFLMDAGFRPDEAASARQFLEALQASAGARPYDIIFLDVILEGDISIGMCNEICKEMFPDVQLEEAAARLGRSLHDTVSGDYLLEVLKEISPQSKVIILSNNLDPRQEMELQGSAFVTIPKLQLDVDFESDEDRTGLREEIIGMVDQICSNVS